MGRTLKKKIKSYKKQFFKVEKIESEPALNKKGFWIKPDFPHVTDKET